MLAPVRTTSSRWYRQLNKLDAKCSTMTDGLSQECFARCRDCESGRQRIWLTVRSSFIQGQGRQSSFNDFGLEIAWGSMPLHQHRVFSPAGDSAKEKSLAGWILTVKAEKNSPRLLGLASFEGPGGIVPRVPLLCLFPPGPVFQFATPTRLRLVERFKDKLPGTLSSTFAFDQLVSSIGYILMTPIKEDKWKVSGTLCPSNRNLGESSARTLSEIEGPLYLEPVSKQKKSFVIRIR